MRHISIPPMYVVVLDYCLLFSVHVKLVKESKKSAQL